MYSCEKESRGLGVYCWVCPLATMTHQEIYPEIKCVIHHKMALKSINWDRDKLWSPVFRWIFKNKFAFIKAFETQYELNFMK